MNVFFIGTYKEKPSTGGHLYHLKLVDALRKLKFDVTIISAHKLPGFFKMRILSFIYLFILLTKKRPHLIIQISDTALRYFFFTLFSKVLNISVIQMVHHTKENIGSFDLKSRLNLLFIKYNLRNAQGVIVNSNDTKKRIIKYVGTASINKIVVIYPGIELKFERRKKRIYKDKKFWNLLSVGSVTERKGYSYLIDALNTLKDIPFQCYIVGNIEDKKYYSLLIKKIKQYNLDKKVIFTGYTDSIELIELYKKSDIFLLPSLHEGYGIVLCEALCQGLPIIATKVGAIPEIVDDGKNGILVKPKSSDSISKAIKNLVMKEDIAERLSWNAIKKCSKLPSWETMVDGIRKVTTQSINRH